MTANASHGKLAEPSWDTERALAPGAEVYIDSPSGEVRSIDPSAGAFRVDTFDVFHYSLLFKNVDVQIEKTQRQDG